jgi:TRAP-type mannitol/chloroaromatic compound transport system permease large subunit
MSRGDVIGLLGIAVLLLLMALRMPIGVAMLLVGIVGFGILNGFPAAVAALGTYPYQYAAVYDFAVIPLFVLMGNLGSVSGMARDLYSAAYAWIGHWRGGLAHATILACAGFAAVSGSSVASAVTMGKVCLPEMRRYNYSHRLATGVKAYSTISSSKAFYTRLTSSLARRQHAYSKQWSAPSPRALFWIAFQKYDYSRRARCAIADRFWR